MKPMRHGCKGKPRGIQVPCGIAPLLAIGLLLPASEVAPAQAAEDVSWEAPDGSFPDHGGCRYLRTSAGFASPWSASRDLEQSTKRAKETKRGLGMIPPRREARIPFASPLGEVRLMADGGACSGIDECVEQTANAAGIPFTHLTSDAEFLRRATLDLTGRTPSKEAVLAFLADMSSDKRASAVDALLETPEWADRWAMFFGDHFRNTWRNVQVNRYQNGRDCFHLCLLESLRENKPYDEMAREIIAAEGTSDGRAYPDRFEDLEQHESIYKNYEDNPVRASPVGYIVGGRTDGGTIQDTYDTLAFFLARDFLGVSTFECVLCQDRAGHLEALSVWGRNATRLGAWGLAAFFSDIPRLRSWRVPNRTLPLNRKGIRVRANYYTIRDLGADDQDEWSYGDTAGDYLARTTGGNRPDRLHSEEFVHPSYPFEGTPLVDTSTRLGEQRGARSTADPQFARAAVNFIWKEFFFKGLVEPADQFDLERIDPAASPSEGWDLQPSHSHLLRWLAQEFSANGFDLKWLMREIATSRTYQLSSRYDGVFSPQYERYFVRHQAKRLTAEQIHDAIITATGRPLSHRASRNLDEVQFATQFPDVNDVPQGDEARILNVRTQLRALLPGDRGATLRRADGSPLQPLNLMNTKNAIFIFLRGAPSHVDRFDFKAVEDVTPSDFEPETFGDVTVPMALLGNTSRVLDKIAIIRSGLARARAHPLAQAWMQVGRNPTSVLGRIAPHIGSVEAIEKELDRHSDQAFPAFMSLEARNILGSGYFPVKYGPFQTFASPDGLRDANHLGGQPVFERRWSLLAELEAGYRGGNEPFGSRVAGLAAPYGDARRMVFNPAVEAAFKLTEEERERYGNTQFGDAVLTARKVIEQDQGTRFIQVESLGWDHRVDIYGTLEDSERTIYRQTAEFDPALAALIEDLEASGKPSETLVLACGEFGRTPGPLSTSRLGRDHHQQMFYVLAGGGIAGGTVIGATNDSRGLGPGSFTTETGWSRDRDIRPEDIEATIYSALGIDWATVRHDDPLERGFRYVPLADHDVHGPVHELWGRATELDEDPG